MWRVSWIFAAIVCAAALASPAEAARRVALVIGNAAYVNTPVLANPRNDATDFGAAINNALQQVNAQQAKASAISEAYERGDTHDIVSVMIERQKASLGFETTLQVRNKLLSAYRDIMNMPV